MDFVIAQIVLAARNSDGEENVWMQLLVFVVLGVFWAVSGIIKARGQKKEPQKQRQPQERRPGLRPSPAHQPAAQKPEPAMRPSGGRLDPQGPATKPHQPATKTSPRYVPTGVKPYIPSAGRALPQQQPETVVASLDLEKQEVSKAAAQTALTSQQLRPVEPKTTALAQRPEIVELFARPEQLRAAILHYEVLGKCVAMREETEKTWAS